VLDVESKCSKWKKRRVGDPRVKWWTLTKENAELLSERITKEGAWRQVENADKMWEVMADCIQRWVKEILGTSRRGGNKIKGDWWWNEEVKEKVNEKKEAYVDFMNSGADEDREISRVRYKAAKKVAKKAVAVAQSVAYDRLYHRLETKEGEKEIFKLVRARDRRTRDLGVVRCIKEENGMVLSEDAEIKERWRMYFSKLFNREVMEDSRSRVRECNERRLDPRVCGHITKGEIKEALQNITNGKAKDPDQILMEVWKCLGEEKLEWLTELFNVIFRTAKMPKE